MSDHDADLVSLLAEDQREDLLQLVASITDLMRTELERCSSNPKHVENQQQHNNTETAPETTSDASAGKEQLPSPQPVSLQHTALKSFDAWRTSVLTRVTEVLNEPSKTPNTSTPHPTKPTPSATADESEIEWLHAHYAPVDTPLVGSLALGHGELVLQSLLLLLLSLKAYDARSRRLLLHLCSSLSIPFSTLVELEAATASALLAAAETMSAESEAAHRAETGSTVNRWKIGLATLAGGALIGVTGGLAAPLVAAGLGSVMGGLGLGATAAAGYLGTLASSGAVVGAMFGAYGGRMSGRMMERYAKEVEDFSFIPLRADKKRLRVAVGITGWVVDGEEDIVAPWAALGNGVEAFALRWDMAALQDLGHALQTTLTTYIMGKIKSEIIKRTVFATLYSALWPLGLMKAAKVMDNPFSIAKQRSGKAGLVLADAIIHKAQGERPLTLVGFSLGARVIYTCLLSLAERGAFGLVENVVLLGAPVPADKAAWRSIRTVVAGRVINVYSSQDYILAFLYRTSSIQLGVAGLQRVNVDGVDNINEGERVQGHLRYRFAVGKLLRDVLRGDVEIAEVQKQEVILRGLEKEDREKEMQAEQHGHEGDLDAVVEKAGKELEERRKARAEETGTTKCR